MFGKIVKNSLEYKKIVQGDKECTKILLGNTVYWQKDETEKPSDSYKRRIMLNDNLRNKTIFADFYVGYYSDAIVGIPQIIKTSFGHGITEYSLKGMLTVQLSSILTNVDNSDFYFYDGTNEHIVNNISILDNQDYIVTEINDCSSYKHLYIEDENIRHLQIGDNLSGATVYFIFPDNFYNKYNSSSYVGLDVVNFSGDSESESHIYISTQEDSTTVSFDMLDNPEDTFTIYDNNDKINISKKILPSHLGEITYIEDGELANDVLQYIFVDKTTLSQ